MSELPHLWAKSTGESVTRHSLKVLENLRQIRERSAHFPDLSSMPHFWERAALSVCLHDLGKCCDGFQRMVRDGKIFPHRHEVLSGIFLRWIFPEPESTDLAWVAAPLLTHHRDWPEIQRLYPWDEDIDDLFIAQMSPEFFSNATQIAREQILPTLDRVWGIPETWSRQMLKPWLPTDPVGDLRAVLKEVRKLMRQINQQSLPAPEVAAGTLLRGVVILADHSGSACQNVRRIESFKDVEITQKVLDLPSGENLYHHQRVASATTGHAILTAPTGSGKTEAAFLWAARQTVSAEGHPVVYYLLPYQASLNAMRERLVKKFGEDSVTLQHSRAVQSLYRQLLDKPYTPLDAQRIAKQEKNLASLHVRPIRISTPYQLLKGAFQLKGHEALWTAAASSLFILDEVHVYETERLAIMLATLRHLCQTLGGQALVMSATLPSYLRGVLGAILPGSSEISADSKTLEQFCRHDVRMLDVELTEESVVEMICADAQNGMGVLVVATTVGRAQALYREVKGRVDGKVEILHGRFHSDD